MTDSIGSPTQPLQEVIKSYLYWQYSDDSDLQAFVNTYNTMAQSYLQWFNDTPLALYTSPNVSGQLLDWIAKGIYDLERPVFSTFSSSFVAGLGENPLGNIALGGSVSSSSGTAVVSDDDYFRRLMTWWLYIGDGRYFNIEMLRKKVARFLYAPNGGDVTLSQIQTVHILANTLAAPLAPTLASVAGGSIPARKYGARVSYVTAIGEGLAGPASALSVASSHLLVVDSPLAELGSQWYNVYAGVIATAATLLAGLGENYLGSAPLADTNELGTGGTLTRQNTSPIAIGTDWTEPTTGIIKGAPLPTVDDSNTGTNFFIVIPSGTSSTLFQQAMNQGLLAFPFQLNATVLIS